MNLKFIAIIIVLSIQFLFGSISHGFLNIFECMGKTDEHCLFHKYSKMFDAVNKFDSNLDQRIKNQLDSFLQKLKANDHSDLLSNFESYLNKFENVKVLSFKNGALKPGGSGQGKKTAIHLMDPPTVVFDMVDFEKAPEEIQNILILHEFFSALGMDDEYFQHSVGLVWLLSLSSVKQSELINHDSFVQYWKPNQKLDTKYSADLKEGRQQSLQLQLAEGDGGGTTSIGGAGDWSAIDIKLVLLNEVKNYFDKMNTELNQVQNAQFLIFRQIFSAKIYTNMNYGLATIVSPVTNKLKVTTSFVRLEFISNSNVLDSINLSEFYKHYFINNNDNSEDEGYIQEVRVAILEQLLHELLSKYNVGPGQHE